MRNLLSATLLLAALLTGTGPAFAQLYNLGTVTVPPQSVIGNTLPMSGNAVAVSFAQLAANLSVPPVQACPPNNFFNSVAAGGQLGCAIPMPALTGDCTTTIGTLSINCTSINGVNQTTAWSTYTPTITPASGTFTGATTTVSGRYKQIGKTVFVQADVLLTALGSGSPAGGLAISLPFTGASFNYDGSSADFGVSGKSGRALIVSPFTAMDVRDATGTTFIATGAHIVAGITYEVP